MMPVAESGAEPSWPLPMVAAVRNLPEHARLTIALSGGLDSVLLLHLAVSVHGSNRVSALHINHGLQDNASDTERFCQCECDRLGVVLHVHRLALGRQAFSTGLEERARHARYEVFRESLGQGALLLMAHHGDDQVETVLFRLLRGTGIRGLAGIPAHRPLGAGAVYRPLLPFTRAELQVCAGSMGLRWIDDPSNNDDRFDRNFLRLRVLPLLKKRWPYFSRGLRHTAEACSESAQLADRLAQLQLESVGSCNDTLDLARFGELSFPEQKNLLRYWLESRGVSWPSVANWREVFGQFLSAGSDREPELVTGQYALRRYRGKLYLVPERCTPMLPDQPLKPGQVLIWNGWQLALLAIGHKKSGPPSISVTARSGGECIRPRAGGPSRPLSKWLQEQSVPPWERDSLPLLYLGSGASAELVAVGDLWQSPGFSGSAPDSGWRIVITKDSN